MARIRQDSQQFLITPDAAAIFRRTIALTRDTDRIDFPLDRRLASFECAASCLRSRKYR